MSPGGPRGRGENQEGNREDGGLLMPSGEGGRVPTAAGWLTYPARGCLRAYAFVHMGQPCWTRPLSPKHKSQTALLIGCQAAVSRGHVCSGAGVRASELTEAVWRAGWGRGRHPGLHDSSVSVAWLEAFPTRRVPPPQERRVIERAEGRRGTAKKMRWPW